MRQSRAAAEENNRKGNSLVSHWQVFYQFNENYAPYAGASLTSLLENNRAAQRITIYLLLENVSDESRKKLQAL